jgi:hypothetical protein
MSIRGRDATAVLKNQFILDRVRAGLSRTEIVKQFVAEFEVKKHAAYASYSKALQELVDNDPTAKERTRAALIEMLHAQIAGCQADLAAIVAEIKEFDEEKKKRKELEDKLNKTGDKNEQRQLIAELRGLPQLDRKQIYKPRLIEYKCRIRDRILKLYDQLANLHGLNDKMPVLKAIDTLAGNGLLPATLATTVAGKIEEIESVVLLADFDEPPEDLRA